jgi:hypothetical protein
MVASRPACHSSCVCGLAYCSSSALAVSWSAEKRSDVPRAQRHFGQDMLELGRGDTGPVALPIFPLVRLAGVFVFAKRDELSTHELQFFAVWKTERAALYGRVHKKIGD